MDARLLEEHLYKLLQHALGREVDVVRSPLTPTITGGIVPEVFLHAARFQDLAGLANADTSISRTPVKGPRTAKGFVEQRAARIALDVGCRSGGYDIVQKIAGTVTPTVLLGLAKMRDFELGTLSDDTAQIRFEYANAYLANARFVAQDKGSSAHFLAVLEFHLDGFTHVRLARRGGFARRSLPSGSTKKKKKSKKRTTRKKKAIRKKT